MKKKGLIFEIAALGAVLFVLVIILVGVRNIVQRSHAAFEKNEVSMDALLKAYPTLPFDIQGEFVKSSGEIEFTYYASSNLYLMVLFLVITSSLLLATLIVRTIFKLRQG
jgi:hypothetical protein